MTTNRVVQEFEFKSEVFPILVIGITLNIVARLIKSLLGFDFFFLDTAGTAFSAILLGPWWAATVGVLSNTINGNFVESFFAYGAGNILVGLGWGYFVRLTNLHKTLFRPGWITFKRIFYSYLSLVLVGTVLGTIATTGVKLIINPAMGRPYIYRGYYIEGKEWLSGKGWDYLTDPQIMMLIDLVREFVGKSILIIIALVFVYAVAFIPSTVSPIGKQTLRDRLKTDSVSIFVFMLALGAYLFVGRLFNAELHFFGAEGAQYTLEWLKVNGLIIVFYTPIVLAALAFLLLSLDGTDDNGKRVNARRWRRRNLYAILSVSRGGIAGDVGRYTFLRDPRFKSIYGLILSLAVWPLRGDIENLTTNPVYLFVLLLFAGIYFYSSWHYQKLFKRSQRLLWTLHQWMQDCRKPSDPVQISHTIHEIFKGRLTFTEKDPLGFEDITYSPCIAMAPGEGVKGTQSQLWHSTEGLIFAVANHPRVMTAQVVRNIVDVAKASSVNRAFILSVTPNIKEKEILEALRRARKNGLEINLLSWIDLELAIRYYSKKRDVLAALTQARVRTMENLGLGRRSTPAEDSKARALARQALPTLAQIIDNLPKRSTIFDLGCTLGRHTFFGLFRGHEVLACCSDQECLEKVHACACEHEREVENLRLHHGDFMTIDPAISGTANLVLAQGILHQAMNEKELERYLRHLKRLADEPGATIFIEIIFEDSGKGTKVKKSPINRKKFEDLLYKVFGSDDWNEERVAGPVWREKTYVSRTTRGNLVKNRRQVSSVDYLLTRET